MGCVSSLKNLRRDTNMPAMSVVSALASGARGTMYTGPADNARKRAPGSIYRKKGPRFDPRTRRGKFRSPNTLSLVPFAGISASSFGSGC